jgi:hypothetical protein
MTEDRMSGTLLDASQPVDLCVAATDTYWPDNTDATTLQIQADNENAASEDAAPYLTLTVTLPGQDGQSMAQSAGGRMETVMLDVAQTEQLINALTAGLTHLRTAE